MLEGENDSFDRQVTDSSSNKSFDVRQLPPVSRICVRAA